jgi:hypothetical protein
MSANTETTTEIVTIGIAELDDMIVSAGNAVVNADFWRKQRQEVIAAWEAEYGEQLENAQANEQTRRTAVHEALQALGVKTKQFSGWTATDTVTNTVKIVDEDALFHSLVEADKIRECQKLDLAAVKRVAKSFNLSGLETITTHSLRLTRSGE